MAIPENNPDPWQGIYKLGGLAATGAVLVGALEILITFLPGGNTVQESALDWFLLFEQNWFMGLRDLGLLNIFFNAAAVLISFAIYGAHRGSRGQPYAALILIFSLLGVAVFLATNRAFAMLDLSQQYAAADSSQRELLASAAQSLLSAGQSHTPGTFLGFFLSELAGFFFSLLMLKSRVFSKATAVAGMAGFGMLIIFEFFASFATGLNLPAMLLAMIGGLLSMAWDILVARRLFQLSRDPAGSPETEQ